MLRMTMIGLALAALTACGGGGGDDEAAQEHDVSVAVASAESATPAGNTATFTASVQNVGATTAQDVSLTLTVSQGYEAQSISCAATGGATCPETGTTMTVENLPANSSLTFTVTVPIPEDARGEVAVALNMAVDGDSDEDDNASSGSTVASDPRNDSYRVFATHGYEYTLTVDFDAGTYRMAGEGLDESGNFSHDTGTGTYTIAGNAKFRVGEDIIVGGFDFGSGVVPFVAARRFVTSLDELWGDTTSFGLNNPGTVNADSRIFGSKWDNGTLKACLQNMISPVDQCAPTAVWTYQLSIDGEVITGVEADRDDTITFRVAKSGSTQIYLRAGLGSSGRNFRISVPEAPNGLAGGTFHGSSTLGGWGTVELTDTSYELNGVTASGQAWMDSAGLGSIGTLQGIRLGQRASDGASVFVMQAAPIAILVGARSGPAAGYMEIGAP